jgi:AcrR family transcriptional regulator
MVRTMAAKRMRRSVGVHFEGDLRRALIDAAAATLDDVGVDGVSLREVARRSGVSHAAPAHHFGDKAGLLTAVAVEGFELFVAHLARVLAAVTDEPVDRLLALGRAYAEFAESHPGHFEVMFRPSPRASTTRPTLAASNAAFESSADRSSTISSSAGGPTPTRGLAVAAWALAHGISVLRTQGSLAKHYPDASLDGVAAIVATLIGGDATHDATRGLPALNRATGHGAPPPTSSSPGAGDAGGGRRSARGWVRSAP